MKIVDCGVEWRKTRSGRVAATHLVLLTDADISDPENEPDIDPKRLSCAEDIGATSSEDDLPPPDFLDIKLCETPHKHQNFTFW